MNPDDDSAPIEAPPPDPEIEEPAEAAAPKPADPPITPAQADAMVLKPKPPPPPRTRMPAPMTAILRPGTKAAPTPAKPEGPPKRITLIRFHRPITIAGENPNLSILNATSWNAHKLGDRWTAKVERYGIALRRADGGGTTIPWANIECWDDVEIKPAVMP